MPYAVINYGAPSQYLQLSEDYQRLMAQQAQMNAARVDRHNQMWSQAVGGGINQISGAIVDVAKARYNDRKQIEAEGRADAREQARWDRGVDWQIEQNTGLRGRDELRQYQQDTGQGYADIVQEQQNEAILSRQRALNDEKIRSNLREQALSPFVLDPQTQQSMKMLPPPIQQNFLENQAQREKVVSAYRSGEVSLPETMTMLKPIDENLNRVASMAQRMRQPTPDEELAQSYATKDGHSFIKNRNGWSQVKEDDSTGKANSQFKQIYDKQMEISAQAYAAGDFETSMKIATQASKSWQAIQQAQADANTVILGGEKWVVEPNGGYKRIGETPTDMKDNLLNIANKLASIPGIRKNAKGEDEAYLIYTPEEAAEAAASMLTRINDAVKKQVDKVEDEKPKLGSPATQPATQPTASAPAVQTGETQDMMFRRLWKDPTSATPQDRQAVEEYIRKKRGL